MKVEWIKFESYWDEETGNHRCNIYEHRILVYCGYIEYIEQHGWDDGEYYFHNGTGKLDGVTHWMPLPEGPNLENIK